MTFSCLNSVSLKARKLLNNGDHFIKFYAVKVSKRELTMLGSCLVKGLTFHVAAEEQKNCMINVKNKEIVPFYGLTIAI